RVVGLRFNEEPLARCAVVAYLGDSIPGWRRALLWPECAPPPSHVFPALEEVEPAGLTKKTFGGVDPADRASGGCSARLEQSVVEGRSALGIPPVSAQVVRTSIAVAHVVHWMNLLLEIICRCLESFRCSGIKFRSRL